MDKSSTGVTAVLTCPHCDTEIVHDSESATVQGRHESLENEDPTNKEHEALVLRHCRQCRKSYYSQTHVSHAYTNIKPEELVGIDNFERYRSKCRD